jgi:hypothetical protein
MPFTRTLVSKQPAITASYCSRCKSFVGASSRPAVLKSAEQAHICEQNAPGKKVKNGKSN